MIIFVKMQTDIYFTLKWTVPSNVDFQGFKVTYLGNRKIAYSRAGKYLGRIDRDRYQVVEIATEKSVPDQKQFVSISAQKWASFFR